MSIMILFAQALRITDLTTVIAIKFHIYLMLPVKSLEGFGFIARDQGLSQLGVITWLIAFFGEVRFLTEV